MLVDNRERLFNRASLPILFSAILCLAIILVISACNFVIIYNIPNHIVSYYKEELLQVLPRRGIIQRYPSRSTYWSPLNVSQESDKSKSFIHNNALFPPFNLTQEERISWFRENLPRFDIFKSNDSAKEFHNRVVNFFDQECEMQFFMTWIAPATSFTGREIVALESLFKAHPKGCLAVLSRTLDSELGNKILKPLLDLKFKILAVTPDLSYLFKETPAEIWFDEMKKGNRDPGGISLAQNLSNLIRLVALYKYGGVYLDTDFIVLKSFKLLRNSIGAQSIDAVTKNWSRLNNAVLVFDRNHPLLFKFIEEFAKTFDGNKWGHNGPYLVSRVVERVQGRTGYNYTVFPPTAFYPVMWSRIKEFFKKPKNNRASRQWMEAKLLQLRNETYAIHLWNKQSSQLKIEKGSLIEKLISDHCVICENGNRT